VAGLTSADFELRDNGVPQQISSISAEKVPLDLRLLLDLSSSVDGPQLHRLKTAVADTASLLRPGDRIRLVATSLYDGMAATMMRASEPGRRQLIVAFTDGRDSTSIIDEHLAKTIARMTDAVVDIVVPVATAEEARQRRLAQP